MWTTGTLTADIMACTANTEAWVDHICYLVNLQDIDKSATTVSDFTISALTYNPGAGALVCTILATDEPDVQAKLVKGNYRDGWDHGVTVRVMENSEAIRLRIDEMRRSRLCVIYQLLASDGTRYFEIAGYELGLEVLDIDRNYNDLETAGGWVIKLGSSDQYKEKDFPYILGAVPGTIVEDATGVSTETIEITSVDVVAGILATETGVPVPVPVAAVLINSAGVSSHYDIQRVDDYHQEVNIGDQLKVGNYTLKILYTE